MSIYRLLNGGRDDDVDEPHQHLVVSTIYTLIASHGCSINYNYDDNNNDNLYLLPPSPTRNSYSYSHVISKAKPKMRHSHVGDVGRESPQARKARAKRSPLNYM